MKLSSRFLAGLSCAAALSFLSTARSQDAGLSGDAYVKEWSAKCDALLDQWKAHPGPPDAELAGNIVQAAVKSDRPDVVDMVAAGRMDMDAIEIKPPAQVRTIGASLVRDLGKPPLIPYGDVIDLVIRRMTKNHFEAWTPAHGWLFNSDGKLVAEAHPHRRDGTGREWHGAFLPDGRWVTTDLWEYDRTLTFYSKSGKWLREIPSEKLAPPGRYDGNGHDLIGWARCARGGTGWVVSVGAEEGRALVFVKPGSEARPLTEKEIAWKLCYPRDLEPKGDFIALHRPSDDFAESIEFGEAGHGESVGYPNYSWGNANVVISRGNHNFGFLPVCHDVYLCADDGGDEAQPLPKMTWFFAADGRCLGWTEGQYLADAPDGKGIRVLDDKGRVLALDAHLKPVSLTRFLVDGKEAKPVKIFTDLRLGFFSVGGEVAMARW